MDFSCLPTEVILAIFDRVPFLDWVLSLSSVSKEWSNLCVAYRSQNAILVIKDTDVKPMEYIKSSTIRDIASRYEVIGLDISDLTRYQMDVPWSEVITASKRLKWLAIDIRILKNFDKKAPVTYHIERLAIMQHNWWDFNIEEFANRLFLSNFPKVTTFSIQRLFTWSDNSHKLIDYEGDIINVPPNTEMLHTRHYHEQGSITFKYLDDLIREVPRLKKLLLNLVLNHSTKSDLNALDQLYRELETFMKTKYNVDLIVRDPFALVSSVEKFKEAYHKNGLPYDYYIVKDDFDGRKSHCTLFCHACTYSALDTMKYLIDSGITSLEKELRFYPLPLEIHERIHMPYNQYGTFYSFFMPTLAYKDLTDQRKEILDFFIANGLNCTTKGKDGASIFEAFGVAHPVVEYILMRSQPQLAAITMRDIMNKQSAHYKTYLELYNKLSKEAQEELKKLLVDFDFSDVLYYIIESRDLQTIKHVVEEFNIDLMKYRDAINEWYEIVRSDLSVLISLFSPAMEDCIEVQDFINNLLGS